MRKLWMAIVIMAMVLGVTGLTGCAKKEAKAPVKEEEKIGEEGTETETPAGEETETPAEQKTEEEAPAPLK
jgi:hypothetical protein